MSEYDNDERISFLTKEGKGIIFSCNILEGIDENWDTVSKKIGGSCPKNYEDVESFCIRTVRSHPESIIGYSAYEKLINIAAFAGATDDCFIAIGLIISRRYCEDNNIQIPTTE